MYIIQSNNTLHYLTRHFRIHVCITVSNILILLAALWGISGKSMPVKLEVAPELMRIHKNIQFQVNKLNTHITS
jgi:hypothetical protein